MPISPHRLEATQRLFTSLPTEGIAFRGQPTRGDTITTGVIPAPGSEVLWAFLLDPQDSRIQRDIQEQNWSGLYRRLHASMSIGIMRAGFGPISKKEIVIFEPDPSKVVTKRTIPTGTDVQVDDGSVFPSFSEKHVEPRRIIDVVNLHEGEDEGQFRTRAVDTLLGLKN